MSKYFTFDTSHIHLQNVHYNISVQTNIYNNIYSLQRIRPSKDQEY